MGQATHEISELLSRIREQHLAFPELLSHAESLIGKGQSEAAATLYSCWLGCNQSAFNHVAAFNLGVIFFDQGKLPEAQQAYTTALRLSPEFVQARFNLGLTLERLGQAAQALSEWSWIVDHLSPSSPDVLMIITALNNIGRLLEERGRLGEALTALERSLQLHPVQPDVSHHQTFLRQKLCVWPIIQASLAGQCPPSLLAELSLSDDPVRHLASARRFAAAHFPSSDHHPPSFNGSHPAASHRRLRIGYCSSDFRSHPLGLLTAELFELHDRERFEVFGFCWSPEDGSPLRGRIISAFDRLERIGGLSDEKAADLIHHLEIEILVDLQGQTLGARPGIFARRPAPLQIAYLGLPTTTGFPFIDFLVTDRFAVPPEAASSLSEKPFYLPNSFMISDRRRQHAQVPRHEECGLPTEGFVFCCFNASNKLTPEMFDSWVRILQAVPGSVLWLLADNPWAVENLRREAIARNLEPHRLVFAPFVPHDRFLAQCGCADLYLDTFPFNGGTTVNDALWMGLPVLTRCGRSFASRMAGSLLTAAGMPELIVESADAFERMAIKIGRDRQFARELRKRAGHARSQSPLFDTPRLVRHLEDQFLHLLRGSRAG